MMVSGYYYDSKYKRVLDYACIFFEAETRSLDLYVDEIRIFEYDRRRCEERYCDFGAGCPKRISIPLDSAEIVDRFGIISCVEEAKNAMEYITNHWLDYALENLQSIETVVVKRPPSQARDWGEHSLMTRDQVLRKYGLQAEQLDSMTFSPYSAQGFAVE